jgi:hypothetical protein
MLMPGLILRWRDDISAASRQIDFDAAELLATPLPIFSPPIIYCLPVMPRCRASAPLPPCHYAIISRFAIAAITPLFATAFIDVFPRCERVCASRGLRGQPATPDATALSAFYTSAPNGAIRR